MKEVDYLLVGGGSGGHLTPLIPIAKEIKKSLPNAVIGHIGSRGDNLNSITENSTYIDNNYYVLAGKFRRYNGESLLIRVFDFKTLFFNIRDLFKFLIGIVQSWFLLGKLKPQSILTKGGFVCAPVGIAARFRKIPYITHDSDSMASLAHRIIGKHATAHATAMPKEVYTNYDQSKTIQVGVPVGSEFKKS